jgi:hypothetical protein
MWSDRSKHYARPYGRVVFVDVPGRRRIVVGDRPTCQRKVDALLGAAY